MLYAVMVLMVLNALWFGAAFNLFSLRASTGVKLLLKRENRVEPFLSIFTQALKFLGGMNLALSLLSIACAIYAESILSSLFGCFIVFAIAVAHTTQLWYNVPVFLSEVRGEDYHWTVKKGTMNFIFRTDALMAVCNYALAVVIFVRLQA